MGQMTQPTGSNHWR